MIVTHNGTCPFRKALNSESIPMNETICEPPSRVIAMAASAGGLKDLSEILGMLP